MASTETSICNSALAKLGSEPILSLDDDNFRARLCKQQFGILRDEVLESHPWNFAIRRKQIAAVSGFVDPQGEFSYSFQLPSDCLRVIRADRDSEILHKIESDRLLANDEDVRIQYIALVTDVSKWSRNFREVLAWRIAWDLAYAITQSLNVAQNMQAAYELALRRARSYDAQEGSIGNKIQADTWINSRF